MLRRDDLLNGYFILQDPSKFCFGIDAVLLAHYPAVRPRDRILDIGCGFAPIPLILHAEAEKRGYDGVRITGLEILPDVADTARRSVAENGISEGRINIITGDINEASGLFPAASFSLITCNPPYMQVKDGFVADNPARAAARTELFCTLEDVIRESAKLLKMNGRLALIHRPGRLAELISLMGHYKLEPKRMRLIYPSADAEPTMVLVEAVKGAQMHLKVGPPLIIYDEAHKYTEEIHRIYGWNALPGGHTDRKS